MASVYKRGGPRAKGPWLFSYVNHAGERKTKSARTTDKAVALRIAAKYDAETALRRDGVIDPALDAIGKQSQRSIEDHLADFESKMQVAKRTEKHITSTLQFIQWIAEYAGFKVASDITADGANKYAGKLRDEGRSSRTVGAHLSAIKAFTRWLTAHQKLPRDPLVSVKKPNPKTDRRRERRAISLDEWWRLEGTTLVGPERYGMAAGERLTLYRTAIQTGLRSNELRSLTRGRLYLEESQPFITCKAGSAKNRKDARQFIQPELAEDLKTLISTKAPRAKVFALPHESNLARMLRDDLAEARKAWLSEAKRNPKERLRRDQSDFLAAVNHEGETIDFHCLRYTCGAWLAMAGVPVKTVQVVMRHSSITLTMDTYGTLFPGQEADAVARLRDMMAPATDQPEVMRATGTDDLASLEDGGEQRAAHAQRATREIGQSDANRCEDVAEPSAQEESPKPLQIADLGDGVLDLATLCTSSGGGTRTPDTRIMIPLL
jgi:integrase